MPSQLRIPVRGPIGLIVFTPPYFDELLVKNGGVLPSDPGAHALWYYYLLASKNLKEAKDNLVYETDLSKLFDVSRARKLLEAVSFMYQMKPAEIVRYWEAVEQQRLKLGYTQNAELPAVLKFRFN